MSSDVQYPTGCSEKYAELCALSTTGELSPEESADLDAHMSECGQCSELLAEYTSLARIGMAKLAPEVEPESEGIFSYREKRAEHRLTDAIHAMRPVEKGGEVPSISQSPSHSPVPIHPRKTAIHPSIIISAAAVLFLCIGGSFEVGRKLAKSNPQPQMAVVAAAVPAVPDAEKADLRTKLAAAEKSLRDVTAQSGNAEQQIAELSSTKASLFAQMDELNKKDHDKSTSLATMTVQRDGLQQQLNDTSKLLEQVKEDLNRAQQDRQGTVLRVASLEQEVNNLHAAMAVTDKAASTNETYLAEDRDIRELMGARQLYISDVFDVQNDGQRSKPFGRVFYTKGKSLIFYAFDLQEQPGYREAKAFQAWGRPDNASGKPISLGIFYMDNEKNSRWVVKSDNPDVLAQINAVFVTVEPQGGSVKPTSKPFLEAYLHTLPPNHP